MGPLGNLGALQSKDFVLKIIKVPNSQADSDFLHIGIYPEKSE